MAERLVVEIKALKAVDNSHLAQVIGYLAITGCPLGLLINFGERSLTYRRVFPPKALQEFRVNRQWLFVPEFLKKLLGSGLATDHRKGLHGLRLMYWERYEPFFSSTSAILNPRHFG